MKKISILIALSIAMLAGCAQKADGPAAETSNIYEGVSECIVAEEDISYPVYVKVATDERGVILSAEDAGTEVPGGKDGKYKQASAIFGELEGKTAETVPETDTVSGATASSEAILSAVMDALE